MNATFDRALAAVLLHEGGYVNNPDDKGGPTNLGITLATYRKWVKRDGTVSDLKALTRAEAAKCYRAVYWNGVKADDLPAGIDYATFDYAVNSGVTRAAKALQGVLGVTVDGIIGPETVAAAKGANPVAVVNALCDQRMAFLKSLSSWATFGAGWTNRVSDVRDDAIQLTANSPPATPLPPSAPLPPPLEEHEEAIAPPPDKHGINWWIVGGIVVAAALAAIALFVPVL